MLPAGAALDKILEHTGYLALAATTPGGVEAGDLLHAVDRVRQVLEDGGSLADAADALAADSEASNEVESLPLEPGRTDVVRLMNLHKAKGLEADVVFLADPCGGMKPRVDVHIKRDGDEGARLVQGREEVGGLVRRQAARPARRLGAAQGRRGAVPGRRGEPAALRRRHARAGDAGRQPHGPARRGLRRGASSTARSVPAKELPVPATVKVASPKPASVLRQGAGRGRRARAKPPTAASTSRPGRSRRSTAEAKHIAKMTGAGDPAAADDATRVVAQDTPSHRADAGMAWGTLIHGLLEHAMRLPECDAATICGGWRCG